MDDATGPTQITDKYVMAVLRSHFVHDLKQFLDIKEPKTVHEFEAIVKQWELTQSHKHLIYNKIGASQRYQPYTTSAQSPTRKPLTCYHCGKVGHIAKECRSKGSEPPKASNTPKRESKQITCYNYHEGDHKSPQYLGYAGPIFQL